VAESQQNPVQRAEKKPDGKGCGGWNNRKENYEQWKL